MILPFLFLSYDIILRKIYKKRRINLKFL